MFTVANQSCHVIGGTFGSPPFEVERLKCRVLSQMVELGVDCSEQSLRRPPVFGRCVDFGVLLDEQFTVSSNIKPNDGKIFFLNEIIS